MLGPACNIGQNVMVAADVILGRQVKVQNNVSIYSGVICEDYVFLGPSCVFTYPGRYMTNASGSPERLNCVRSSYMT